MNFIIRAETPADIDGIHVLTAAAFATAEHSSHTEQFIVDALRARGELAVSLLAEHEGQLLGHVAVSPVAVSDGSGGWYGLGPISVLPARQGQGIGAALMRAAIDALRQQHARGCVLLGEPAYYGRFGFRAEPGLVLPGVPAEYFQALCLQPPLAQGEVRYSPAFDASA
ncbi:TPA: N-acetyltransferase [Stenotrophomonas maltophilia]|uniref:GNAT family N-acetyltransferase n=1 Tax=Stenotrophomonas maltophilia TaxID=40324 RepID=UPI0015DF97FB|nr:N-acetyltransferase [Stenotrophomonas maltophilia]MBA0448627.1 N-acetyltransferase [Stenotrophomonas maltophilia]HEL2979957.1 N-acetyltransferase [Stenotrophomonas maltophilia]